MFFVASLRMQVLRAVQGTRELRKKQKEIREVLLGGVHLIFFHYFERCQLKIELFFFLAVWTILHSMQRLDHKG